MSEIVYMEKPEWVSWDAVADCLHEAHAINKKRGFEMPGLDMAADKLKENVGNGHCLIAWDGEKVVGTATLQYRQFKRNKWLKYWTKGEPFLYCGLDGIRREYQGSDVFFELDKLKKKVIEESGVEIIGFNTSEHNKVVLKMTMRSKWKPVLFSPTFKGSSYYSIYVLKWIHGCPYPDWYVNFMFKLSKVVVKTLWKPGWKFRFWFN